MHVTRVVYEKLVNLGNYENQKIGVAVELEPDESPAEALRRAQAFVEKAIAPKPESWRIEEAEKIVAHADDFAPKRVREAQNLLSDLTEGEIPF